MSFWMRLLRALGFSVPVERTYYLDQRLVESLQRMAMMEQRTEDEMATEMISDSFARREVRDDLIECWLRLSPREQQVTMLICYNFTTNEIAAQLVLSTNTVKSHIRSSMRKFDVHSRNELRMLLSNFDFGQVGP
jgi:DNA-binding CsgD family transcriptional regulator